MCQEKLRNILKNKEKLREFLQTGGDQTKCHLVIDQKYGKLNEALYEWFKRMREERGARFTRMY